MAKKEKTPEQIEVADQKKAERIAAKELVRSFMKDLEDKELKDAIILLIGTGQRRAGGGGRTNVNALLRDAFLADDEISEMDLFLKFKIGRPEMTTKIRIFLKTPNPEDRVWVTFDADSEVYKVVGLGAETPKGWDGFVPADEEVL